MTSLKQYLFKTDQNSPLAGRINFSKISFDGFEIPNSQGVQVYSYTEFMQKELVRLVKEFSPFESSSGNTVLEIDDVEIIPSAISETECYKKGRNFQHSIYLHTTLINKETEKIKPDENKMKIFLGEIPQLTRKGNFMINGVEKFVVSQIVRSPGAYLSSRSQLKLSDSRKRIHEGVICELLPLRGALMLFKIKQLKSGEKTIEIVSRSGNGSSIGKFDVATLLRGVGIDIEWIRKIFADSPMMMEMFEEDRFNEGRLIQNDIFRELVTEIMAVKSYDKVLVTKEGYVSYKLASLVYQFCQKCPELAESFKTTKADEGSVVEMSVELPPMTKKKIESSTKILKEISAELCARQLVSELGIPTRPNFTVVESYQRLINLYFFEGFYYGVGEVGRIKLIQKLSVGERARDSILAQDVKDMAGKVVFANGTHLNKENFNKFKQLCSKGELNIYEKIDMSFQNVEQDVYCEKLSVMKTSGSEVIELFGTDGRLESETLHPSDFLAILSYLSRFESGIGVFDDIDNLGNKRLRLIKELLSARVQMAMSRVQKLAKDRMDTLERKVNYFSLKNETLFSITDIVNTNPFQIAMKEFFNSHQLTQFLDQQNPLSELANKRRISAMGPGGINREDPNLGVRDVHYSHYGRICPIETPEGMNIGLIMSLASYGKANKVGILCTPYFRVDNAKVTSEIVWLTTHEEDNYVIAESSSVVRKGKELPDVVVGRFRGTISEYDAAEVDFIDISPNQVFSLSTTMIPFLEHDDANRALMGANMQRQAVPLLKPRSPVVGTGVEAKVAQDSGYSLIAKADGKVEYVDGGRIVVNGTGGEVDDVSLIKFKKSNQSTCVNQAPIVTVGDSVKKGQVLADGPSMQNGELALGQNLLVAFTTWYGFGYEDAIILSSRLFKDDVLTSVHTQRHTVECSRSKSGDEEITRDIPRCTVEARRYLDEDGVIMVGASVVENDIIVGKVTPKVGVEHTPEEKLLQAIFAEKVSNVFNTSLKVPPGGGGVVSSVVRLAKHKGDVLNDDVIEKIHVSVSQKRKIQVGDKLAGRHGNKGVISKIVREEDMPYLEDGTPVDIILSPLGVPSRMNIGQVLESHLGMAAKGLIINKMLSCFFDKDVEGASVAFGKSNDTVIRLFGVIEKYLAERKVGDLQTAIDVVDNLDYLIILSEAGIEEDEIGIKVLNPAFAGLNRDEISDIFKDSYWKDYEEAGKFTMFDGKTGEKFKDPISAGIMYILKLDHMVDDKIYARSVGPYSKITQQPLGGKCQNGGQRFGEMEVWVMEAYGAAYNLRELLTLKSDDIYSRNSVFSSVISNSPFPEPQTPESFKLLIRKLESCCLKVGVKFGNMDQMVSCDEYLKQVIVTDPLPHEVAGIELDIDLRKKANV